jgi:hypothetical protein
MKKQYRAMIIGSLFTAVCGPGKATQAYNINLMMPPILAAAQQKTDNVIGWQPLNDTGITWSGNYTSGNNDLLGCVADPAGDDNVFVAQDCSHGRDVSSDDSDGQAGFSFTKLGSDGEPLDDQNAGPGECVKDNVTGLIWEVKTDDDGLHDKDDTYTWYNTNSATNGGPAGTENPTGQTCSGWTNGDSTTYCNTQAYVNRVNTASLCGATDWRMPTVKELESLVDFGTSSPAIDISYFPNTVSSFVWSGSPVASNSLNAWQLFFNYGGSNPRGRSNSYAVRLVRGGQ